MRDGRVRDWATALAPALRGERRRGGRGWRASASGKGVVVTTGQQPGLFGGPVYTWSKALSALALADAIEAATGIPAAPVFWAATYDADFAESSATLCHAERQSRATPTAAARAVADRADARHAARRRGARSCAILAQASGSAAAHSALDAVRRAYARRADGGRAYVALLRALLEPLGIAVLDAGHPAVRGARPRALRAALERAGAIDAALCAREQELREPASSRRSHTCRGLSTRVPLQRAGRGARIPIARRAHIDCTTRSSSQTWCCVRWPSARCCRRSRTWADRARLRTSRRSTAVAQALGAACRSSVPRWSGMVDRAARAAAARRATVSTPDELRDPHAAESRLARERDAGRGARGARAVCTARDARTTRSAPRSRRTSARRSCPTRCSTARGTTSRTASSGSSAASSRRAKRREADCDARHRDRARVALSARQAAGARAQLHSACSRATGSRCST